MRGIGKPIVICGPSGSGKSTLLKRLLDEFCDCLEFSVSHTTRKPRYGELDGREYHFTTVEAMRNAIANNEFIEYTEFSGNLYGTSKKAVEDVANRGKICALDLEMEGVKNLKKTDLNPLFIFIKPPNIDILEQRLRERGTESTESLEKRLDRARQELDQDVESYFDLVIVNDDLEEAYKTLRSFVEPILAAARNVSASK